MPSICGGASESLPIFELRTFSLDGVVELTPRRYEDERGFFTETCNAACFAAKGINTTFVQDNHSYSAKAGTLRGLHYQLPPRAQAKFVRVVRGTNFVKTMLRLASARKEIAVVADQRGNPSSALDIAAAVLRAAVAMGEVGAYGTYHLAGSGTTSWADFARHVFSSSRARGGRGRRFVT